METAERFQKRGIKDLPVVKQDLRLTLLRAYLTLLRAYFKTNWRDDMMMCCKKSSLKMKPDKWDTGQQGTGSWDASYC